jgi:phenylalanyl-tRNA synthetase beta chain
MIVSWNWLSQYVRLDMPEAVLSERLALTGLNHESTEEVGGDLAIDLEVTSNRPDCLSHLGVAREISVVFGAPFREPDPRPATSGEPAEALASVEVDEPGLCPRFTARVVRGAKIGEAPWWMRKRLETLGIARISNVVDVTNYVMFECGQPLHAYDLDKLAGRRLIVRKARPGETLVAINGKTYELTPEMLVIADAERPVGLAGVMGGLDTEIGPETRNILIEAAQFDAVSVRRTARALGLFSPSSYRFERPMDPERTEWASRRCAELVLETAGGVLHPGVIDVGRPAPARSPITLRLDQIPRVLGIAIDRAACERILGALGLELTGSTATSLTYQAPSWRADLDREIDLIEEVARIHGYEHIPEDRPVPLTRSSKGRRERVEAEVRSALTGLGFDEAYTFSLVAEPLDAGLGHGAEAESLKVDHSSRKKENALRQALIPSLLAARAYNEAHGNPDAELFEVANVYRPRAAGSGAGPMPDEPTRLAIVGGRDFLGMKGAVEALLGRLHLAESLEVRPASTPLLRPGRAAELVLGGTHAGFLGEVHPDWAERLGLRSSCTAAEIAFDLLVDRTDLVPQARPLPAHPAVGRDLSLVVDRSLPWSELAGAVKGAAGPWLEGLTFLDTFEGGNIPPGRHSLHFGLRFRHPERTLTGEEVDRALESVIGACRSSFDATLRV